MKNELDESYCLFGAQTLVKRLRDLIQEIDGVRKAEDIEHLHRMRVASRRIRSTLAIFEECFSPKSVKTWRKQMRRITRTLGDARDADVQIDFLETFLDSLEEARYHAGIKRLLLRIRQKREGLQRKVITVMDRLEASGVLENIEETLRQIRIHGRLNKVDVHTSLVYQQACSQGSPRRNVFGSQGSPTPKAYGLAISLKLDEMLAYEPYVRQPERVEELHAMRIAAKRLRYTIEVFEPLYHEELKSSRQVVREVQTILGDIHDYDVWVEYLPQFLEEERVRTLEYFGHTRPLNLLKAGILYLQQECQQHRDQRYKEFVEFWEELQHQAVWENLEQILHARLEKINGKK